MSLDGFLPHFLLGLLGALILEVFKAYEYLGKLPERKLKKMMRSPLVWSTIAGMLIGSGVITWLLFYGQAQVSNPFTVLVVGGGARSTFRQTVAASVANSGTRLGDDDISLRDIFL